MLESTACFGRCAVGRARYNASERPARPGTTRASNDELGLWRALWAHAVVEHTLGADWRASQRREDLYGRTYAMGMRGTEHRTRVADGPRNETYEYCR